jgi:hypothetical protein
MEYFGSPFARFIRYSVIFGAMKLLCYLMVIVLTGLIMLPCMDHGGTTERDLSFQQSRANLHEPSLPFSDTCSPLCSCSCCSIPAFRETVYYSSLVVPLPIINGYVDYQNELLLVGSIKVWQPPKLNV